MSTDVGKSVQEFYSELPFNYSGTDVEAAGLLRSNPLDAYPDVTRLLKSGEIDHLVEFACGTGWFSNSAAFRYGVRASGIDFTEKAIERARAVARVLKLGDRVDFIQADLTEVEVPPAPLVVSIGALHHLRDAREGFLRIARFVAENGHLFVGLYHEPARRVFLRHYKEIIERRGEQAALETFASGAGKRGGDATLLRSWFRDQVLHPHESQHTLAEVLEWLRVAGLRLVSTSINRFAPFDDVEPLLDMEKTYEALSRKANIEEGRFFPGFFTILAVRE